MAKKRSLAKIKKWFERLRAWAGRHKFWAVVLGLIISYSLLWSGQAAVERYNYYRVGNLLEDMLVTLPDGQKSDRKIETLNSCGRGSAKFSAGPLRCAARSKATYQLSEFNNPEQIYPEIYEHINSRYYANTDNTIILPIGLNRLSADEVTNDILNKIIPDFGLDKFTDFGCSLGFDYGNTEVTIVVSCTRDARMEYFGVRRD